MKVLLDACVWGGVRSKLEMAGHDVVWVGDSSEDPGDSEILAWANREGRVCVTLDKDFGELAVVYGRPHCGIVRLVDLRSDRQAGLCLTSFRCMEPNLRKAQSLQRFLIGFAFVPQTLNNSFNWAPR